jgi:hypothetical protein
MYLVLLFHYCQNVGAEFRLSELLSCCCFPCLWHYFILFSWCSVLLNVSYFLHTFVLCAPVFFRGAHREEKALLLSSQLLLILNLDPLHSFNQIFKNSLFLLMFLFMILTKMDLGIPLSWLYFRQSSSWL